MGLPRTHQEFIAALRRMKPTPPETVLYTGEAGSIEVPLSECDDQEPAVGTVCTAQIPNLPRPAEYRVLPKPEPPPVIAPAGTDLRAYGRAITEQGQFTQTLQQEQLQYQAGRIKELTDETIRLSKELGAKERELGELQRELAAANAETLEAQILQKDQSAKHDMYKQALGILKDVGGKMLHDRAQVGEVLAEIAEVVEKLPPELQTALIDNIPKKTLMRLAEAQAKAGG